jgi:hypothetical protein
MEWTPEPQARRPPNPVLAFGSGRIRKVLRPFKTSSAKNFHAALRIRLATR